MRSSSRIFYRYIGWRNWLKNYFKMVDSRTPIIKKMLAHLITIHCISGKRKHLLWFFLKKNVWKWRKSRAWTINEKFFCLKPLFYGFPLLANFMNGFLQLNHFLLRYWWLNFDLWFWLKNSFARWCHFLGFAKIQISHDL